MKKENVHNLIGIITDEVVKDAMNWFIDRALSHDNDPLYLLINSGGGGISTTFALIDLILTSKANHRLHTIALGQASSMAIPLFLCGSRRIIGPRAKMIFHHLGQGVDKEERWPLEEIRRIKIDLEKSEDFYSEILLERCGIPTDVTLSFFEPERTIYANELVKLGIAHEIMSPGNSIF